MTKTATPAVVDESKTTPAAAAAKPPTRDRILFATAELFRRQGYHGTGLKQIVAEADAPFGSLYHHYPGGKQELGEQVIESAGAFFQALVTAVYDAESSTEDAVRAVFAGAAATLEATDYEDACPIAAVALEVASTDDRLRRATAAVFERWTEALTERLGDRAKALAVIAALEGAFVLCRASRSTEAMHAAGEMAAALVA
ncbi:MAG TPA: TetR/AcrR family transcriptional regulator [Solirubrobacterales bacterium]|nr:TetR/AcrR family transcriptional regulator [Solirubrobacterales bacterium]